MKNKKLLRFVESLILLPITTVSMPFGSMPTGPVNVVNDPQVVISEQLNNASEFLSLNNTKEENPQADIFKLEAAAIDAYFKTYDMPLEGTGLKMATEAYNNGLDWRLVAAISVRESTGGRHDCQRVANNPFGWGSCKIGFKTLDAAIETVARNLGGNNPKTAQHYDDKTTIQILRAYNPPSIVPKYAEQVMKIMDAIGPEYMGPIDNINA